MARRDGPTPREPIRMSAFKHTEDEDELRPMDTAKEFRIHAEECRRMADGTRSEDEKRVWRGLAAHWQVCAELAEQDEAAPSTTRAGRKPIDDRRQRIRK